MKIKVFTFSVLCTLLGDLCRAGMKQVKGVVVHFLLIMRGQRQSEIVSCLEILINKFGNFFGCCRCCKNIIVIVQIT